MKIVGIDLAGNPKNDTGFCDLEVTSGKKSVTTKILHFDVEIIGGVEKTNPEIIAIDAPLTYSGVPRKCDGELREYGSLPVTLRGMEVLAIRGKQLAEELKAKNFKVIEVFSTASAKILGFYSEPGKSAERKMQKKLLKANLSGDIERKFLTKDELDAVFAAITGYLYLSGSTRTVGDDSGKIVIPEV